MKPHGIVTACLAFAVSAALPVAEASDMNKHTERSSIAKVFGKTYGEWSAAWWQWAVSTPASESPVLLTDDDLNFDCSLGQHGPVWFLAGLPNQFESFDKFISLAGERTCSVPRRKALFFPIVNAVFVNEVGETTCADGPLEGPCTIEEKRAIHQSFSIASFGCTIEVLVDETPAYTELVVQTQSPPFLLEIGADDPIGFEQGSVDPETISSGFWMMLPPLSRGEHELTIRGGLCSSEEIPEPDPETAPFVLRPFFAVDVTYHLFVGM